MLIRSLRAENFQRFSRLRLTGLPLRGLIGIEGPNETGKSTIGEALLFALFGKTQAASSGPVTDLIRWGADSMSVELELVLRETGADGDVEGAAEEYLIYRLLDRYGTNYVKVLRLPGREEVATGNARVAEFLARRIGFCFTEFLQSFYHDQHDRRRLEPEQLAFFESATGLKQLARCQEALRRDAEPLEREFAFLQKELGRSRQQVDKYAQGAIRLAELSARLAKLPEQLEVEQRRLAEVRRRADSLRSDAGSRETRARTLEQLLDGEHETALEVLGPLGEERQAEQLRELATGVAGLRGEVGTSLAALSLSLDASLAQSAEAIQRSRRLGKRGRRRGALGLVALALALLSGAAIAVGWGGLPAAVPERWRSFWPEGAVGAAATFAGLAAVLLVGALRSRRLCGKAVLEAAALAQLIEGARAQRALLESALAASRVRQTPALVRAVEGANLDALREPAAAVRRLLAESSDDAAEQRLEKLVQGLVKGERDHRSRCLNEAQKLEKSIQEDPGVKRLEADRARLESEIRECQTQLAKKEALEEKCRELEGNAGRIQQEIDVRLLACRLVEETTAGMRTRLAPTLTRYVKSILPLLTQGRYREVRVEPNLEIRVYSSEKNDVLALGELSGGTCEALCLALRLGMSHALVASRGLRGQFVFLDEPFRMMDASRAAETLRVLPRLSPDLEQFFVARPNFSPEERALFDCVIATAPNVDQLELSFAAATIPPA